MRRSLVAVLIATLLLVWPVNAQIIPTVPAGQPAPATERVLIDTVLHVHPPADEGLCMVLDPGLVTVTTRRVQEARSPRPAEFRLMGFMADPEANAKMTVNSSETTTTLRVLGIDRYCWSVSIDAPETAAMDNIGRGAFIQRIALKITLTP